MSGNGGIVVVKAASPPGVVVLTKGVQGVAGASSAVMTLTVNSSIVAPGTYAAAIGNYYYLNLNAIGGSVTLTTGAIGATGGWFFVKLIVSTGGFTCTINPPVAGSHIESLALPGTLTTSLVMAAVGQEYLLVSPNAVDLWY